jgi:hypothetical protein
MIPNFPPETSPTIAYSHPMELATEAAACTKAALTTAAAPERFTPQQKYFCQILTEPDRPADAYP